MIINENKSVYGQRKIKVLGYVIENNKVTCDVEKALALKEFGAIITLKQLRKYLGELEWIRKFYLLSGYTAVHLRAI